MFDSTMSGTILFLAAIACLVALAAFFAAKAVKLSKDDTPVYKFSSVLHVQNAYDRIRKSSKIPCSVLYLKLKLIDRSVVVDAKNQQKVFDKIADILLSTFGNSGSNMIAPFQGKEYVVLTNQSEAEIIKQIHEVNEDISDYCYNNPYVKSVEVNVGAYLMPASVVDFETATKRCKIACDESIANKQLYIVWDYNLQKEHDKVANLDESFLGGLEKSKFFIELQPVIDITTGQVYCAEALTRLSRDNAGVLKPKDFLAVIDNMGIYDTFDYMIFEKACKWLATHRYVLKKIHYISVNFSRSSIASRGFAEKISEYVELYGLPYSKLGIEILENKAESEIDMDTFVYNIKTLRDKGMVTFLDDFGVGYTSFDDIRDCPIDILKIDKSIVQNTQSERGKCVFSSIINIARQIHADVICEGVEKPEQLDLVKEYDCKLVQGYYFYRPMRTEQFEKLLNNSLEES